MSARRDLNAKPGDWVLVFWDRLGRWIDSLRVISSPDMRVSETPYGTLVRGAPERPKKSPFKVVMSSGRVKVKPGLLAGMRPRMSGAFIDGFAADASTPTPVPWLELTKGPAKGETCTWVVIHPPAAQADGKLAAPEITHETALSDQYQELAMIVWKVGTPTRVVQIVGHHLDYQVGRATAGDALTAAAAMAGQALAPSKPRVFFWGV